jgi:hypothetical protein
MSPADSTSGGSEVGSLVAIVPFACTTTLLSVYMDISPGSGVSETITLRTGTTITSTGSNNATSNFADSTLSCTVSGSSARSCTSSSSVSIPAGQLIDLKILINGGNSPNNQHVLTALVCQ